MLSKYIFVYTCKLISFKYFKGVSPATFVNKSDSVDVIECLTNISNIYTVN